MTLLVPTSSVTLHFLVMMWV
eukprot:COSAG02_NODE_731_length_17977_cov_21.672838_1_plen_20_part_10